MSEKILGVLQVIRPAWSKTIHERLIITPDRTLVIREWEKYMQSGTYASGSTDIFTLILGLAEGVSDASKTAKSKKKMQERERYADTPEKLLKADKNNVAIPNSIITEVRLRMRFFRIPALDIVTNKKKYKWRLVGLNNQKKGVELEDYEKLLRPVFGDKLSVKK